MSEKRGNSSSIDSIRTSKYKESFVTSLLGVSDWAANQGYHKLDSVLVVSVDLYKRQLDFAHAQLDSLQITL
jgi:hypothetical protein